MDEWKRKNDKLWKFFFKYYIEKEANKKKKKFKVSTVQY